MSFIGISGPQHSGKSTLVSLLENQFPIDTIVIHDMHETIYEDMISGGRFSNFHEISKDRDYLLIYYGKLIKYYTTMIDTYKDYPGLVVFDGTYIDLLIYGMLSLWYHYPSKSVQESLVHKLLDYREAIPHIYMTKADDINYKLEKLGERRYNTSFLHSRKTELVYYDIFRLLPNIVTLPSTSVLDCDLFILNDMRKKSLI